MVHLQAVAPAGQPHALVEDRSPRLPLQGPVCKHCRPVKGPLMACTSSPATVEGVPLQADVPSNTWALRVAQHHDQAALLLMEMKARDVLPDVAVPLGADAELAAQRPVAAIEAQPLRRRAAFGVYGAAPYPRAPLERDVLQGAQHRAGSQASHGRQIHGQ